jgi:DNA repair exonuclease SbcCD ATPase subunit
MIYKHNTRRTRKIRKSPLKNTKKKRKQYRRVGTAKYNKNKKRGGNNDKVNCCNCGKEISKMGSLIPRKCSRINYQNSHRLCKECWFDGPNAFANENRSHNCPGCEKKLPLTINTKNNNDIVDLTEED